jgi:hypothetical protein
MIYIVYTFTGPIGFTADELVEFLKVPDHKEITFRVESAVLEEEHECPDVIVPEFLREILI